MIWNPPKKHRVHRHPCIFEHVACCMRFLTLDFGSHLLTNPAGPVEGPNSKNCEWKLLVTLVQKSWDGPDGEDANDMWPKKWRKPKTKNLYKVHLNGHKNTPCQSWKSNTPWKLNLGFWRNSSTRVLQSHHGSRCCTGRSSWEPVKTISYHRKEQGVFYP